MSKRGVAFLVFAGAASVAAGQFFFGGGGRRGYGEGAWIAPEIQTAREVPTHSTDIPMWHNPPGFENDTFTFARIRWDSYGRGGRDWQIDAPDADLGLSYRLQQMTTIRTNPNGRFLRLTDPDLRKFPFTYIVEPGNMTLTEPEIRALREYLLNGGFLMIDDFWGDSAWRNVEEIFQRVFPNRRFEELPLSHPLYSCVFKITSKGQVPNFDTGERSQYTGQTWESRHDGDVQTVHHRAIHDDKGRMMVFAAHNTDNGDGWEREGEYKYYFENFSEKIAYPLGINVVFYAMTH